MNKQHKSVNQIYLRDWSMRNEILKKAQMYETSILNPSKELKSNMNEARGKATPDNEHDEKMNLLMSTPLHYSDNVNSVLKSHCNRSGVHISIKGTNFCDILIPDHPDDKVVASTSNNERVVSTKDAKRSKQRRPKQNENISKYQENDKEKAILDETIQSLISIDKL